jgi:Primase C terminal 2 (PriCT-2)/BT4734-like, N-terminal domain
MSSILDKPVSIFAGVGTKVIANHPLGTVLNGIRSERFQEDIARLRLLVGDKAAYKAQKELLTSFTPCCTLRTRVQKVPITKKLTSVTGIVHYDFDTVADLATLKARVAAHHATVFVFTCPSGLGAKVGLAASGISDDRSYKRVWRAVLTQLKPLLADDTLQVDRAICYVGALCFVSDDPDLYLNPDATPLDIPPGGADDDDLGSYAPGTLNTIIPWAQLAEAVWSIPCEDRDDWREVGTALHDSGYPQGRALWDVWSQQSAKYDPVDQDRVWHSFTQGLGIDASFLLTKATKYGYQLPTGSAAGINHVTTSAQTDSANPRHRRPSVFTTSTTLTTSYPWPTLAPEARYGLAGDYVGAIAPHTESDPAALLMQLLTVVGVNIGRQRFCVLDGVPHYTNLFAVIAGLTARARKGTSYAHVERQLQAVDSTWGLTNHIKGCGSGEGLIYAVRDRRVGREPIKEKGVIRGYQEVELDPGVEDKRALYQTGEFSGLLKVAAREGNTLSEVIRDCWDTGYLRNATKAHPLEAHNAHIGIIGHITIDELQKLLTSTDMANGFGNRFLWVCAKRSQLLPRGGNLASVDFAPLRERLVGALAFGKTAGEMQLDEQTIPAWDAVYGMLSEDRTGLANTLLARAEPQVMRLAMLYAVLDQCARIGLAHLNAALALWEYTEDSAAFIFGQAVGDATADPILQALTRAGRAGKSHNDLVQEVFSRNIPAAEVTRALHVLEKLGRIVPSTHPPAGGRGRPSTRYTRAPNVVNVVNVVKPGRYLAASNDAAKTPAPPHVVPAESVRGKSHNGVDSPFVPDMTGLPPAGTAADFSVHGYTNEDMAFEEGVL